MNCLRSIVYALILKELNPFKFLHTIKYFSISVDAFCILHLQIICKTIMRHYAKFVDIIFRKEYGIIVCYIKKTHTFLVIAIINYKDVNEMIVKYTRNIESGVIDILDLFDRNNIVDKLREDILVMIINLLEKVRENIFMFFVFIKYIKTKA